MLRPRRQLTWHITLEVDSLFSDPEETTKQTINLIESRLNAFGVPNFNVTPQPGWAGVARIMVDLPEVEDRERITNVLTAGGKLEIDAVVSPPHPEPAKTYKSREDALASLDGGKTEPPNRRILIYPHSESGALLKDWVVVELPVLVDGGIRRGTDVLKALAFGASAVLVGKARSSFSSSRPAPGPMNRTASPGSSAAASAVASSNASDHSPIWVELISSPK
jgi:hypothetical protein